MPKVDLHPAVSSGLDGEEQTGESPAAAVSVHKRQGARHVMLNHGSHRGEELCSGRQGICGSLEL